MQTFLPYPNFTRSAQCLDDKRLGKQRVEVLTILRTLQNGGGWEHHPAVKMWRGWEIALATYGHVICVEWIERGLKDTCLSKITSIVKDLECRGTIYPPYLFEYPGFCESHQSNLVRKDPTHYRRYFPTIADDLPYVWPTP